MAKKPGRSRVKKEPKRLTKKLPKKPAPKPVKRLAKKRLTKKLPKKPAPKPVKRLTKKLPNAAEMWAALPRATGERVLNARMFFLQEAALPNQTDALRQMLDLADARALEFLKVCEELGLAPAAARSAYFSPKARKVGAMPG